MLDAPLFEVTTPAADGPATRRLTTAAKVQAALKGGAADTALIEQYIDEVTGDCVTYAKLMRAATGAEPTFAEEILQATWLQSHRRHYGQGENDSLLLLPWRAPVTAIGTVVEDDVELVQDTDFRLLGAAQLQRTRDDRPVRWSRGKIVVPYTAGWDLPDGVPPGLEGRVIDQVKMKYLSTNRDPAIIVENVYDVARLDYGSIGAGNVGDSGLLKSLEAALGPYKNWQV